MAVALSLLSAFAYGVSDFLGGIIAKRASAWQVAVVGQGSSSTCSLVALAIVGSAFTPHDVVLGALAGLGGGFGVVFLYRGLSTSRMGVVAPVSAIGTALLPVVVGLATGDRPSLTAVIGLVAAFPAIALISYVPRSQDSAEDDSRAATRAGVVDGALAGAGFGVLFALLGQVDRDASLVGLAASQAASLLAVIAMAVALRQRWVPSGSAWRAAVMGPLGVTAQAAFLFASQRGLLSVVAVISSLYPASTVLLASVVLRERILRVQAIGLVLATAAVVLVALA